MSFGILIWEIWSKHSELLLDSFQKQNLELCPIFENFLGTIQRIVLRQVSGIELFPYFENFLVTMGTKFGYTSFIEVVILEV